MEYSPAFSFLACFNDYYRCLETSRETFFGFRDYCSCFVLARAEKLRINCQRCLLCVFFRMGSRVKPRIEIVCDCAVPRLWLIPFTVATTILPILLYDSVVASMFWFVLSETTAISGQPRKRRRDQERMTEDIHNDNGTGGTTHTNNLPVRHQTPLHYDYDALSLGSIENCYLCYFPGGFDGTPTVDSS